MDFPISSVLEKSVSKQVNKIVGDKDTNLNTIVKMSLLNDGSEETLRDYNRLLDKMRSNNEKEQYYIAQEYELTYDCGGNLVPVNNVVDIYNGETEKRKTDIGSVLLEPEQSE